MRFNVFVFALVTFVVAVSGCPIDIDGGGSFAMGNGLQINSFEFKPARLVSGQPTLLKAEIQNMGSRNIEDVKIYLFGLSSEWYEGSSLIGEFEGADLQEPDVGGLRAANEELKTEGEKAVVVWNLNSPEEYLKDTEFVHKAYVRACYEYETSVLAKVEVVGENEWLVQEQSGKYSQHPITVKQTAAPISVQIESMQPVIVGDSMSMELKVSNVGGGVAFAGESVDCSNVFTNGDVDVVSDLNSVRVGDVDGRCTVEGVEDNLITLARGEEKKVLMTCEGFSSDAPRQEFDLNLVLSYGYYVDADTSVVLVGVEGES